jgi:hypothetical protein
VTPALIAAILASLAQCSEAGIPSGAWMCHKLEGDRNNSMPAHSISLKPKSQVEDPWTGIKTYPKPV